jgi:hypothetical protein
MSQTFCQVLHEIWQGGLVPDCAAYVSVCIGSIILCRFYKLTFLGQVQVTLLLRVIIFHFSVNMFSRI